MEMNTDIQKIISYIQESGMRDPFLIVEKCKTFCENNEIQMDIIHCEKSRNFCNIYYSTQHEKFATIQFKLKNISKSNTLKEKLNLTEWEKHFNLKVLSKPYHLDDMKTELISWVSSNEHNIEKEHFLETMKVYLNFNKQVIISYTELNGEKKKIKPILNFFEPVELNDLIECAKLKSRELWGREFDGEIKIVKEFWVTQLGTYDSLQRTIYFSAHKNGTQSREQIMDTLIHELVHWYLDTIGKPFSDTDFEFIEELLRVGGKISGATYAKTAFHKFNKRSIEQS